MFLLLYIGVSIGPKNPIFVPWILNYISRLLRVWIFSSQLPFWLNVHDVNCHLSQSTFTSKLYSPEVLEYIIYGTLLLFDQTAVHC